ncbi:hypothetical protein LSH36_155g01047 [Paralvinella palmiformis]|uniref:Beta-sarcoglycan n=1 Tax=Paralvinella palmiformis TaxID=53620 RepID=A0AAD9JVW9_9ANNE|nr:hypothetical protein LSH36_155g01047 [Paralvinella palmiformis]
MTFLPQPASSQITGTILTVLNIGREGMSYLEFIPNGLLLRFLKNSNMGDVLLMETEFGSLPNQPLELTASEHGQVQLSVFPYRSARLTVTGNRTVLTSSSGVEIIDPDTGETVFSTSQKYVRFPEVARTMDSAQLVTDRVTSDTKDRLSIKASKQAILVGYNGISFGGRTVSIKGKTLSFFTTKDLIIDGAEGTRLLFYKGLPIKDESAPVQEDTETYKLCVHSTSGELFSLPWNGSCHRTVLKKQ